MSAKVKVAVRVRPMNKRGMYSSLMVDVVLCSYQDRLL